MATSSLFDATNCLQVNVIDRSSGNNRLSLRGGQSNATADAISAPLNENRNNSRNAQRSAKLQQEVDAMAYLQRYGYMNGTQSNANLISEDSFHDAIVNFQRFAGIPETGVVDNLTVRFMQMPRCGNKDRSGKGENGRRKRKRRKRYALQGSKWRRQELTYRISQYPTRFAHKKHEVDAQIEKAFKIWSQVAPIDFVVKKEGRVHIDIRFASGEHGDGDPFDGPGNTLAHAYFPQYGGDAHFDDQEYWTVDSYAGTNIFQVAAHELGHSLGLGHSSVREALMAPFYQKYKPNFKLHADDVLGIQALYGDKDGPDSHWPTSTTTTTTTSTTPATPDADPPRRRGNRPSQPDDDDDNGIGGFFGFGSGAGKPVDLCQDSKIDAITRTEDGNTYIFRGNYYWLIKSEGLASGYPARISRDWDGLPGNLDAALTWSDGKTFFFKGDKYWRFFNKRREPGYPKQISAGFAGIPNNVDAAFVWSGNGKTYFFKKDKYWRFDSKQEPPVSSQYPKSIKNWSGLPTSGIDAAFKWENGMTYFFKDDLYYRFDDREFEVDASARPTFPRSTSEWWYGCTNSNLPIRKKESDNESSDSSGSDQTSLLHHKKPALNYESPRLGGHSISRTIINTLSSLFPSSSSSSSSSDPDSTKPQSSNSEEWSFHRGVAEETRRAKSSRSSPNEVNGVSTSSNGDPKPDGTRWIFPVLSQSSSNREQSLSELKMQTDDNNNNQ